MRLEYREILQLNERNLPPANNACSQPTAAALFRGGVDDIILTPAGKTIIQYTLWAAP